MLRNKKAISLTTMVITVMIMFIIMGTLVYSAVDSVKIRKLNNLYNDLKQLEDAVGVYYLKNDELPVFTDTDKAPITINKDEELASVESKNIAFVLNLRGSKVAGPEDFVNPNDFIYTVKNSTDIVDSGSATYKYLNLSLLNNLSLNNPTNEYIINTQSHTIYNLTGVTVDGKTYHSLPLTYINTEYNKVYAAKGVNLRPISGLVNGENIFFSLSSDRLNLKDLLVFDSEQEGDGLGTPEEINFALSQESDYYTLDKNTGVLKRKANGITNVSDISSDYNAVVTVTAKNYGETEPSISKSFTISTSSVNLYSTEKEETIDHISLVKKHDEGTYVYQKNVTSEKEYQLLKNGYLSGQNAINVVPKIEDNELVSATYNNNNNSSEKYVVFESKQKTGSTEVSLEVQEYGLARDTISVDVYSFEIYKGSAGSNTNIDKLNFGGLGENYKTNVKLNFEGPRGFKFNGADTRVEWSLEENDGIVSLSQDEDITKATIVPLKIGQAKLRCSVIVENEKLSEMLIPITVSGIERVDGEKIENNTISLSKGSEKSIDLKYTFGDKNITSYKFETPRIVPSTDFTVTDNEDGTFTVAYIGNSEVTGNLIITVIVEDEKLEDTINITVS